MGSLFWFDICIFIITIAIHAVLRPDRETPKQVVLRLRRQLTGRKISQITLVCGLMLIVFGGIVLACKIAELLVYAIISGLTFGILLAGQDYAWQIDDIFNIWFAIGFAAFHIGYFVLCFRAIAIRLKLHDYLRDFSCAAEEPRRYEPSFTDEEEPKPEKEEEPQPSQEDEMEF